MFQFGPNLLTDTLNVSFLEMSMLYEPAAEVFHGVLGSYCMLDLLFCAVGANMLNEARGSLVGCHGICPIDFLSIDSTAPGPFDQGSGPLDGRSRCDSP